MEKPYLSSDETIVLTTQGIVIDGHRFEAVLTSRRLILIRSDDAKAPHREIFLSAIGSAIAGENALREPTITLTLTDKDGVLNTLQMVFIRLISGQKNSQYEEWVAQLKERIRLTLLEPAVSPIPPPQQVPEPGPPQPPVAQDVADREIPADVPPAPADETPPPQPAAPTHGSGAMKIAVIVVIIVALAIGAYAGIQLLPADPAPVTGTVTSPTGTPVLTTPSETASPAPPLTASPTVTPESTTPPVVSEPGMAIPSSGVWVLVDYTGSFTGSIGTSGRMRDIAGRGARFFQLYELSGVAGVEIQKKEKNGERMTVILYRNGTEIQRGNTTAPGGTVYINTRI